MKKIKNEVIL